MWSLDEKSKTKKMNFAEKKFYNENLNVIKKYYQNNNKYWTKKKLFNKRVLQNFKNRFLVK